MIDVAIIHPDLWSYHCNSIID